MSKRTFFVCVRARARVCVKQHSICVNSLFSFLFDGGN